MPQEILDDLLRLLGPRLTTKLIDVQIGPSQNVIDRLNRIGLIVGTMPGKPLRVLSGLALLKIFLKDFHKRFFKLFSIMIVAKIFSQKVFQRFRSKHSDDAGFQTAPAQHLPF